MPKISVIIPVYNAEKYLNQTLESILNQSLKDIEIICVDDGSTDRSSEIIDSFVKKDQRVKLLHQENLYAGAARNNGLSIAKGEYVHFMDADDYVLDYAYEAIYNKVKKYDLDCLKFSCVVYDMQRECEVESPSFTLSHIQAGDFNRLLDLREGSAIYKANVAPWNGIYRRSFLEERNIRFNQLFCVNDRSFFSRVISNAGRMMLSRDRLVVHRVSMSESLVGVRAKHFDCHFRSIEIVSEQLKQDQIDKETVRLFMKKEFKDLFVWYKQFYNDENVGEQIVAETRKFVHDYAGLCQNELHAMYRETILQVSRGIPEQAPAEKTTIYWDSCKKPKVSVVLPIYNVEDYLNEALYSLTIQSLHEMEFICVNDGSTDGSMTIIQEYAALDKRFRIIDKPNSGYGHSMNVGIDAARGQYLGILEPDDFVPASMFRALYRVASKNHLDFVKADFYRFKVREDGSLKKYLFRLSGDKSYYNRVVDTSEDIETFKFVMNTWSGIYSLDFLNKYHIRHNETPGASYQDNGFWFQTFCRAKRAWFVDHPYYMNRRDNPNSSMFNRQKVYCVTEEYNYIWEWMSKEPGLIQKYSDIFYEKKYSNFMVTYRRIAEPLRAEYLQHICDEFRQPVEEGKINRELFGEFAYNQLLEILADPKAYYEKIRVSVVMPVYNAELYLRQCLDSLLVQNNQRIEIICVDDGSTDNSLSILREYEEQHPEVRVFTQENAGPGAARNTGMQYVRGEYTAFLDADDFFESDMLYQAYRAANAADADMVVYRSDQYLEEKKAYRGAQYTIDEQLIPLERPFAGLDIEQDIFKAFVGWPWDKLFRTEFIRENDLHYPDLRNSEDMLFVFSAVVRAKRITTINTILAHHRRNAGSVSVTREDNWDCFYHSLMALKDQIEKWGLYERLERDFINYALHYSIWNIQTLRGKAYYELYDKFCKEWAADFHITEHDEDYFYNLGEYETLQTMMASTAEDYLFDRMDKTAESLQSMRGMCGGLRNNINSLKKKIDVINEEKVVLKEEKAVLKEEKAELKKENRRLRKKYESSTSWKAGRAVTWIPRKLKSIGGKAK